MYCCNQGHCPKYGANSEEGKKAYCCVVPRGLCCPEYSDSYCETYNNNPRGLQPNNRAQDIRASCCTGTKTGESNVNTYSPVLAGPKCCKMPLNVPHTARPSCPCRCNNDDSDDNASGSNQGKSSECGCQGGAGGKTFNYKEVYVGFNEIMYGDLRGCGC